MAQAGCLSTCLNTNGITDDRGRGLSAWIAGSLLLGQQGPAGHVCASTRPYPQPLMPGRHRGCPPHGHIVRCADMMSALGVSISWVLSTTHTLRGPCSIIWQAFCTYTRLCRIQRRTQRHTGVDVEMRKTSRERRRGMALAKWEPSAGLATLSGRCIACLHHSLVGARGVLTSP